VAQAEARKTPEGKAATRRRNQPRWQNHAYREQSREWQRLHFARLGRQDLQGARARLQRIVDAWKEHGCVDCGVNDPRVVIRTT
jgi:hypothetical protein